VESRPSPAIPASVTPRVRPNAAVEWAQISPFHLIFAPRHRPRSGTKVTPLWGWQMTQRFRLRDVFTPGGLPSVTYVSRDHLELEKKLSDALSRGYAFTVVTGPTKSGKSVLCRRVLENSPLVIVEGGQIRSEADFWGHIAFRLNIAKGATKSRVKTSTTTATGEGGGGIPGIFQTKGGFSQANSDQRGVSANYDNIMIISAITRLLESGTALMVDDFHYIDPSTQKSIIQSLKSAVFSGLPVFLVAVPHRAFDPVNVENEVEGRFKHIEIPQWALDDLIRIPNLGFPALNVEVERATQRRICEDGFGNPHLVQEICSEFCLKNNVSETQSDTYSLDRALLEPTYREMAESKGFPTYQRLKRGPERGRSRQLKRLPMKGGGEEDIYTAILASVARLGPKTFTSFDDIRASLREILAPESSVPARAQIIAGLSNMSRVANERGRGEPTLEWVADDAVLVVTDPFLLFYLKWSFRNQTPDLRNQTPDLS
jgi:hypothetical protein